VTRGAGGVCHILMAQHLYRSKVHGLTVNYSCALNAMELQVETINYCQKKTVTVT